MSAQQEGERRADGGVGEAAQRLGRLNDVPDAANVGERDQERRFALGATQRPHQFRLVVALPLAERPNEGVEQFGGRTRQEPDKSRRILFDQRPKVGRMIGEAEQHVARPAAIEF